jgi:hypothetical protein
MNKLSISYNDVWSVIVYEITIETNEMETDSVIQYICCKSGYYNGHSIDEKE